MRRPFYLFIIGVLIGMLAAVASDAFAQENNPCQFPLDAVPVDPGRLVFHIADIDKAGVTTIEFVVFMGESEEPQQRVKVARAELRATSFPLCYAIDYTPAPSLPRDGRTRYTIIARTEDASMFVSAWSARSNAFTLGTIVTPEPLPLPVPGVRVLRGDH